MLLRLSYILIKIKIIKSEKKRGKQRNSEYLRALTKISADFKIFLEVFSKKLLTFEAFRIIFIISFY